MRGEDAREIAGEDANEVALEVEVERSGAPQVAPAGGEQLRTGAVFGGEKGHDVSEDAIGEAADPVGEEIFLFQPPLLGSGDHPHGRDGGAAAAGAGGVKIGNSTRAMAYDLGRPYR